MRRSETNGQLVHNRRELPAPIIKEAKHLRKLGVAITDIHRILSDTKSHVTVPGFRNSNINYYDVWKILGFNSRASKSVKMA